MAHIPQIFKKDSDGNWVKRKKPNKLIDEIRELASQFAEFECVKAPDDELILETKELARKASRI